ncbi:bifunctional diguanylate cyclase/phosphodiesterase [Phytohabitans sp. ZYX-F-186]|uniref:Bifunctional diguanylate cyclase/phosphodiesterase n=1 Tax=Phytohabitans maris TaxID=3071409 RepID=A0ABU0ZAY3_9ACTN|nr:bifunctional diguanylate cyclase/phosphodiesterase [Phytohabitans sp. ZYX-F-186]MDQ7904198.1 bifunctional diguanylate cyclase/phosphodiesterase [Phytohabitans sp. ZYX-F-186]
MTPVERFAREWGRSVHDASYVLLTGAERDAFFVDLTKRIAAALTAELFDPAVGYQVGVDLASTEEIAPEALGRTITELSTRLLSTLDLSGVVGRERVTALVEALSMGYSTALHDHTLDRQEAVRRADIVARSEAEQALRRSEERLRHAALHDSRTGLPNRAQLTQWLGELRTDPAAPARFGVCLIGLDRFRAVNNSLGYAAGDRLLAAAAERLADLPEGVACHLGGDEFALLVRGTTGPEDAIKPADRALAALRTPFEVDGHELPMSASAGVVERAVDDGDPADALRAAAMALHWAKVDGRDRWRFFDEERNARAVARYRLSAAMPGALARGEFGLAYQPMVNLATGAVVGVECLARWDHPELGRLLPGRFITLAEDSGFILPLGMHLLEMACRQAVRWHGDGGEPPFVSVNLAARQLCHPGLAAEVAVVLDRVGLPPHRLQLEITEHAAMTAEGDAVDNVRALAGMAVRVALDDFGTGYCGLSYLRRLPVQAIKLAGSFVAGLDGDGPTGRTDEAVLRALIQLGHTLRLTVTAEGIESEHQRARLHALGCDLGQGWLLGRPKPSFP